MSGWCQRTESAGTVLPAAPLIPQDLDAAEGRGQLETLGYAVAAETLTPVQ